MGERYANLSRELLCKTLAARSPENRQRKKGYALVNVLSRKCFFLERIPGSIGIPGNEIGEFERRFDKEKTIILYGSSPDSSASRNAARELAQRGFQHVFDYRGGMSDWKEAGNPVESQPAVDAGGREGRFGDAAPVERSLQRLSPVSRALGGAGRLGR